MVVSPPEFSAGGVVGVALPSEEDQIATQQVREALATIGVVMVDHIIVADNDFVSMADSGLLG